MNLKSLLAAAVLVITSVTAFAPSQALAASQDECAIWLCLPGGFPSGCGSARSAMKDRIKDLKSPLPSFSSCAISGGSEMTHNYSYAALIAEHRKCKRWDFGVGKNGARYCAGGWETIPQHYRKGTRCRVDRDGDRTPEHCVGTYRFVDVFVDGEPAGPTYYWR